MGYQRRVHGESPPRHPLHNTMNCTIAIAVLSLIAVAAARDGEEFGIWAKGPQADMCLNTNLTILAIGQVVTPTGQGCCCAACQDVCTVERNTSKIICGYDNTIATMCVKE